ncbi:uncharacterized protein LOC108334211 [Vigna angularis]|uniref:uncharacterized protein LOC108334211 n=1 Tax=Phaseolus angularis TaxID=3914 RepID=UPI0022B4CCA8|nr:uncharacterized protein LOC108334211 [Vigna angularis]XP_052726781.1 uncharacterized protein LOC108334211 [Vigna angularis]XP_052726782.1 uncharacterized protein LOC108334211 [Vigna angularis]
MERSKTPSMEFGCGALNSAMTHDEASMMRSKSFVDALQENIKEEMPTCRQLFNIFDPYDPVAYSAIILHNKNSRFHIDAHLDLLSPTGQNLFGILRVLWKYIQPSMRIVLNPLVVHFFYLIERL